VVGGVSIMKKNKRPKPHEAKGDTGERGFKLENVSGSNLRTKRLGAKQQCLVWRYGKLKVSGSQH